MVSLVHIKRADSLLFYGTVPLKAAAVLDAIFAVVAGIQIAFAVVAFRRRAGYPVLWAAALAAALTSTAMHGLNIARYVIGHNNCTPTDWWTDNCVYDPILNADDWFSPDVRYIRIAAASDALAQCTDACLLLAAVGVVAHRWIVARRFSPHNMSPRPTWWGPLSASAIVSLIVLAVARAMVLGIGTGKYLNDDIITGRYATAANYLLWAYSAIFLATLANVIVFAWILYRKIVVASLVDPPSRAVAYWFMPLFAFHGVLFAGSAIYYIKDLPDGWNTNGGPAVAMLVALDRDILPAVLLTILLYLGCHPSRWRIGGISKAAEAGLDDGAPLPLPLVTATSPSGDRGGAEEPPVYTAPIPSPSSSQRKLTWDQKLLPA